MFVCWTLFFGCHQWLFYWLIYDVKTSTQSTDNFPPSRYETQQSEMDIPSKDIQMPQLITIYLIPKDGDRFQGYELLQSFSSQGLHLAISTFPLSG